VVDTSNKACARIESSILELRARLASGRTDGEGTRRLEESAEAVGDQGLDFLDRIGWFEQVDQIVALPEAIERFRVVAELFDQNEAALQHEATTAGLEDEYQLTCALLDFLSHR